MYLLEEIKGQCLIVLSFCLYYNVDKQVNTDNKHRALLFISKAFCLDTVINHHRASRERQSEHVSAITLNTERSPRNSHEEGQNGCISVQKYPLIFNRGIVLFGDNNAALFCA